MFSSRSIQPIAQGVFGSVKLIAGNFSYFTKKEASLIQGALCSGQVLVMIYDRDSILTPANERAMWIREHFKHHRDLEVRVVYGALSEQSDTEALSLNYIKNQLPLTIQASDIQIVHDVIKQDPVAYKHLLFSEIAKRVISPFKKTINSESFQQLCEAEKPNVKRDIAKLNINHPNQSTFFARTRWNLDDLNRINLPIVIGNIKGKKNRDSFSCRTKAQVFDMPIYMPGQGWQIPLELGAYQPLLAKMVAAESLANGNIKESNAYVTVDCGVVFPSGYARRGGLHVDGFLSSANARASKEGVVWGDNTYIVSDVASLQTELYPGPFDLSAVNVDDPKAVLNAFEVQGKNMAYLQSDPYDIARLTTNNVHAVHPNLTGQHIQRTFIKVTFSERLFNRGGNTINPNFNYRFFYVPRENGRNTQNFIGVAPAGFQEVDLRDLDFVSSHFPEWISPELLSVSKNPNVRITAVPAKTGEVLETVVDGQVVTTNIARAGDMKVSRVEGDSYFLSDLFKRLYKPTEQPNVYAPIPSLLHALQIRKNVTFSAPWGTRQNIPAGGYIVKDAKGEVWGVHQHSFEATYQKVKF